MTALQQFTSQYEVTHLPTSLHLHEYILSEYGETRQTCEFYVIIAFLIEWMQTMKHQNQQVF
jgi:hypothetical protein